MAKLQRQYDFQAGTRAISQQVDDELNSIIEGHNALDDDVLEHKESGDHDERYYQKGEVDTKITNVNASIANKQDKNGNFTGTWHGMTPSGLASESINGARLDVIEPKMNLLENAVDEHLLDTVSHVTEAERLAWDGKQNALPLEQKRRIYIQTTAPSDPQEGDIWIEV